VSITSPAQVQSDWNATTGLGSILNKPTLFSGSYTDLTSKPALFDGDYNSLTNKPALFSGSYTDLTSKPALFDGDYNSLTNKPTLFDGNYDSLSNKPTVPSVSGILKEVASWTSNYLGDGLQPYTAGGGPIVTGSGGEGGPLGGWYQTIYYEFDPSYFAGYNAATIAHVHLDYAYPVYWIGYEGGSVMSMSKTYSIVRRQSATGPVLAVGVTIACNQSRYSGADMWPYSITLHFYANQ
jgi:hypothetical protein